jgi:hypothetical protein
MFRRTVTISFTLILLVAATQVFGYNLFGNPAVYSGADAMSDIVAADINGDGFKDIIAVPLGADYIFVHYNDGSGFFYTNETITVGSQPASVIATDYDNDGDIDIAVSRNAATDNVKIFNNFGDGTFATPLVFTADASPVTIRAADMDGDSYIDLVTTNMTNNTISIFSNDQNGSFSLPTTFAVGPTESNTIRGMVVEDFDNDGDNDMAISTKSSTDTDVYLFYNNGDATFAAGTNISVGVTHGLNIIAAKFDQNEFYDIILPINGTSSGVLVYLNFGTGTFVGPLYAAAGVDPVWVTAADFDYDGDVDIAVANRGGDYISVLYNIEFCALDVADNYFPGFSWVSSVVAADFDNNGTADLAGTKWCTLCGGAVGVVKNTLPDMTSSSGATCNEIPGDVNQDGNSNILDLNYLVNYLFRFGPVPSCGL